MQPPTARAPRCARTGRRRRAPRPRRPRMRAGTGPRPPTAAAPADARRRGRRRQRARAGRPHPRAPAGARTRGRSHLSIALVIALREYRVALKTGCSQSPPSRWSAPPRHRGDSAHSSLCLRAPPASPRSSPPTRSDCFAGFSGVRSASYKHQTRLKAAQPCPRAPRALAPARLQLGALVRWQERKAGRGAAQRAQRGGREAEARARQRQLAAQAGSEHARVVGAQAHRVACAARALALSAAARVTA